MASTEHRQSPTTGACTGNGTGRPAGPRRRGLDALDTVRTGARRLARGPAATRSCRRSWRCVLVLVVWQLLVWAKVTDDYKLPRPPTVWDELDRPVVAGHAARRSSGPASRAVCSASCSPLAIGTPLGLLVARVKFVRAAIGPILSGLQSLPSVAWVPPAVIWLGLNDSMMYAVILLGAVPVDRQRAGRRASTRCRRCSCGRAARSARPGCRGAWHIVLPAALPGYLAGLKQGWAFSWRSLMAAEIIASSPDLGLGLGQLLENGRNNCRHAGDLPRRSCSSCSSVSRSTC